MNDRFHHIFIAPQDFEASLAFYRDVLGWSVTETWGGKGEGRGAILSGGGVKVVISERPEGNGEKPPNIHLDIHDLDARFQCLPKGTHVVQEPTATHWGTRWFVVEDPDGNRIAFEEIHPRGR